MTDQTTQTAVDTTNAPAEPGAAGAGAQENGDELDTLLKEFDTQAAPPAPAPQTQPVQQQGAGDDLAKLVEDRVGRALEKHETRQRIETQYNALIEKIHTDTGASQRLVRGFIEELGKNNPELGNKYFQAKTDAERNRIVTAVTREFQKELSAFKVDQQATEDHAAVTAAVRGASTKAPEGKAPDYSGMSNAEFRETHKREYGYYPPV